MTTLELPLAGSIADAPTQPSQPKPRKEKRVEDPIKKLERELVGLKIDGFFPTPPSLVELVMRRADVRSGMRVLEPSAGKGDLADACNIEGVEVDVCEISLTLQTLLKAKGYSPHDDFMDLPVVADYDRVVMAICSSVSFFNPRRNTQFSNA